ncbi:MAG TPA: HlyD family efflux transporter periplasmic adaptor subunit [Kofleriaceae bacterium]|nr:HlyD family efflux transporter periplasmic adaptor subunit [Kofleriaceae bacterium]
MSVPIILASRDGADAVWIRRCLGGAAPVTQAPTIAEVLARSTEAKLIVIAEGVGDGDAADVLDALTANEISVRVVRLGSPARIACDPRVAFVVGRSTPDPVVAALLISLAWGRPAAALAGSSSRELDAGEAERRSRAYTATRPLAVAEDPAVAARAAAAALRELVEAERVRCVFVDATAGDLWSADNEWRADRGVVGWVARTGAPVALDAAAADARWSTSDDPDARPDDRVLVQPLLGEDREVHAVLVAARAARRPPFGDRESAAARTFAELAGPLVQQLARHVEARAVLDRTRDDELFRREAALAHAGDRWGDVLRVTPGWVRWAYAGLVVALLGGIAFLVLGRVATYARGAAVVRLRDRAEVTAGAAGNVGAIAVSVGQKVAAGDVIARLDDTTQLAEVTRLERTFRDRLRQRLLSPADAAAGEAVAAARVELERARGDLDERRLLAPRAGVVGDLRVRAGQRIEPGDVIGSIVDPDAGAELLAIIPGGDRPRLAAGQHLRLELDGFHHAYQDLVVESFASEAMGSEEALRYLGRVAADVGLRGPVVLVRARLPGTLVADGEAYPWIDGMGGTIHIELENERVIDALVPGLGRW